MANEYVDLIRPRDLVRLNGSPVTSNDLEVSGSGAGVRLLKSDAAGFSFVTVIPGSLTVGTGVTLSLGVTDDGADAADLGKVVRLGVTVKKLASGSDSLAIGTGAGTEQTVDVMLDATSGEITLGALAIANANLDSAGAGDTALVRVRRIGTHANDTCQGTALLTHVAIKNT